MTGTPAGTPGPPDHTSHTGHPDPAGSPAGGAGLDAARDTAVSPAPLAAVDVARRFGAVTALESVTLRAPAGMVTCLLGDNGAGKSTLIGILSGVHEPDAGRVEVDGVPVRLDSPRAARHHGIATVHQDLAVIPLMSVWRNFFLGREPTVGRGPLRRLDVGRARRDTRSALAAFGIPVQDVDRPLATLSGGERQSVAIARAVHSGARVLILDEPTAALGVRQSALVLDRVRQAREQGVAVILVSHDPHAALSVGDAFVVLRHGRVLARRTRADTDARDLADLMAGA